MIPVFLIFFGLMMDAQLLEILPALLVGFQLPVGDRNGEITEIHQF